jgi:very-short-patch-repair endonuclease
VALKHPNRQRRRELKQQFAVHLREEATDAERKLWSILRSHQIAGLRFRRQQPIGPYIVDFYCSAAKLIIELDGDQHGADRNALYDEARTQWLRARGYSVLRFPNRTVFQESQEIVAAVAHVLAEHDIPLPEKRSRVFRPSLKGRVKSGVQLESKAGSSR